MALYSDAQGRSLNKIYKRVGLRRDRNFSDLSSPSSSLENILDTLKDDDDSTYLFTDLGAIQNIFAEGLSNDNYLNIAGSAVRYTTSNGQELSYDPRITYQNRLDKVEVFSGNPRLNGGDGLTARYFQNDQILFNEHANFEYNVDPNTPAANVFTDVTNEGQIPGDKFWEEGNFGYTAKIHPQSAKTNTGVMWEGYFIPPISGEVAFTVTSTGYFSVDFNKEGYEEDNDKVQTGSSISAVGAGNTFTEHIRIGISTSISGISGSTGANEITVSGASEIERMNTIGIGMSVVHSNIVTGTKISDFNKTTGVITLLPPSGNAVTGTISNQSVTFNRSLGDQIRHTFTTQTLIEFKKYRVRFRYFHHKNFDSKDIERSIHFDYNLRSMSTADDLRFNQLYSLDYDFSDGAKGEFNKYVDNSVLFGGTDRVGLGNSTNSSQYTKLKSSKKLDVTYTPKQFLGDSTNISTGIVRNQKNFVTVNGKSIISAASSSDFTTNIEVGNYVFGNGIPEDTRVTSILTNQFVIIDKNATSSGTSQLKFINHRGFVKRVIVNSNGGSSTINAATDHAFRSTDPDEKTTMNDVQTNMIGISTNISGYKKVDSMSGATQVTLNESVTTVPNEEVFFYQSRGLKDNSMQKFCDRFSGNAATVKCLTSNVPEADAPLPKDTTTSFVVEDTNGVQANWELQGVYFGVNGITVNSVDTGTKTITLNSTITAPLPDGAQFTAVAPGPKQDGDYQLCCPPTDTSPPFDASEDGLNTTSEYKDFKLDGGNLIFDELTIKDTTGNAADLNDVDGLSVNKKINIKTPSGTFKILATT